MKISSKIQISCYHSFVDMMFLRKVVISYMSGKITENSFGHVQLAQMALRIATFIALGTIGTQSPNHKIFEIRVIDDKSQCVLNLHGDR